MPSPTTSDPIDSSPSRKRRDTRVAAVLAHTVLASSLVVVGFALSLIPTTACLCDCGGAYNFVYVPSDASQVPIAMLSITGSACGDATCVVNGTAEGCPQFSVKLKQKGVCHVVATASDGRMAAVDLDVQHLRDDSCCGEFLTVGGTGPIDFSFDAADAGGQ
jgi:hypothetical protein